MSQLTLPRSRESRRVALSSLIGTTVEMFDFHIYVAMSAVVFPQVFFSSLEPWLGTMLSLTTLVVGYVGRLFGGILLGHFGDRYGRKQILVLTMTVMGAATGLIGFLPSYAQIGVAAPIVLVFLRVIQGIALGGEYGGAVLMSAEHSSQKRRGLSTSVVAIGTAVGGILSYGALALVTTLSPEDLVSWGWRLPFLFSFLLLGLGLYVRFRVSESPVFREESEEARTARMPLTRLLRNHWRPLIRAIAIGLPIFVVNGIYTTFLLAYALANGQTAGSMSLSLMASLVIGIIAAPAFAALSDRVGRKPVMVVSIAAILVLAYPSFLAINTGSYLLIVITQVLMIGVLATGATGVVPALYSEMFPTAVRFTGVSMAYQLAQILGTSLAPAAGAGLLLLGGGGTNVGWIVVYVVVAAVIGFIGVWRLKETRGEELTAALETGGDHEDLRVQ